MKSMLVKVGRHVVNLDQLNDVKWEGERLFLHLCGGAFARFDGHEAQLLWTAICDCSLDLETGQVGVMAK